MTNTELDELTAIAEDLSQSMMPLLLNGDGCFVSVSGPDGQIVAVASSDVLAMVAQGERKAYSLYAKLRDMPRRKTALPKTGV